MSVLRVGTRGSALALWQTRWVCARLQAAHPELEIDEVVLKTHGDVMVDQPIDEHWPVGGFVGAIECAVLDGRVDFAVHSLKDLPTRQPDGLRLATGGNDHSVRVTGPPTPPRSRTPRRASWCRPRTTRGSGSRAPW